MNFDVKGIDLDGIQKMVAAVQSYKRDAINALASITSIPATVLSLAIKGNSQAIYNNSVNRLNSRMTGYINQLSRFESALNTEIKSRYINGEQSVASSSFSQVR